MMVLSKRRGSAKMNDQKRILVAMGDVGLAKELKKIFDGNLEMVQNDAEAVKKFNEEGYNVIVLDYLVRENAVQAAIRIKAFSNDVRVIGYRWERDFEPLLNHRRNNYNRKSHKSLVEEIGRTLGMEETYIQQVSERFDDIDRTPTKVKK